MRDFTGPCQARGEGTSHAARRGWHSARLAISATAFSGSGEPILNRIVRLRYGETLARRLITIRLSESRPAESMLAIRVHDGWFYIGLHFEPGEAVQEALVLIVPVGG